jgi:NTE family protein
MSSKIGERDDCRRTFGVGRRNICASSSPRISETIDKNLSTGLLLLFSLKPRRYRISAVVQWESAMRAYAVFAGGGVKGAALAGCMAAAQNYGFDFRGYGGTSAGSIVAFLGAVGYSGIEIGEILTSKSFTEFLDDDGPRLDRFIRTAKSIGANSLIRLIGSVPAGIKLHHALRNTFGLYSGSRLTDYLWGLARDRLELTDEFRTSFTFESLNTLNRPALKIVASDVSKRRAVVFPRDCDSYGASILAAVRASAGFPFVFRPVRIGTSYLVDGGVASNLPSFLFGMESAETRFPTLAFDLVQETSSNIRGIVDFIHQSFFTCLEASDVLIRDFSSSVHHIPIPIPNEVRTLDFRISATNKKSLFDAGYRHTDEYLGKMPAIAKSRGPGMSLQKQLMAQYGDPKLYQPVLSALIRDIEGATNATDVRANVMLLTGRHDEGVPTRIVVYQVGMDDDQDKALEMKEYAGCSGEAWKTRRPAIANLEEAAKDPESWDMSKELHLLVPTSQKSMISVPIPGRTGNVGQEGDAGTAPVGTLSVDSSTALTDTLWMKANAIDATVAEILTSWAYVVARILP